MARYIKKYKKRINWRNDTLLHHKNVTHRVPTLFSILEINNQSGVDLSSGKIIGHGVLIAIRTGNPIIRIDVLHIKQIKDVQS